MPRSGTSRWSRTAGPAAAGSAAAGSSTRAAAPWCARPGPARRRRREDALVLLGLGDGTPEGITGEHVTLAAREGDPVAKASFDTLGHWLGQGLADLAAVLDPECFVLGGGVSEAGEFVLTPTIAAFEQLLTGRGHRPMAGVVLAQLGNDAGVVGAADLARYR